MMHRSVIDALDTFYAVMVVTLFVPLLAGLYARRTSRRQGLASLVGVPVLAIVHFSTGGAGYGALTPVVVRGAGECAGVCRIAGTHARSCFTMALSESTRIATRVHGAHVARRLHRERIRLKRLPHILNNKTWTTAELRVRIVPYASRSLPRRSPLSLSPRSPWRKPPSSRRSRSCRAAVVAVRFSCRA